LDQLEKTVFRGDSLQVFVVERFPELHMDRAASVSSPAISSV
jgi:hypothetical protein